MTTLLIDNYDSFTWNVYQSLANLGANVLVYRNDQITLEEAIQLKPRNVVISPGPGYPSTAGISTDIIQYFAGKIPVLGVCLGEQAMYELYGGKVRPCGELIHGKTTPVKHDGKGLFLGVSQDIECARYHSLAGDPDTLPSQLEVTSWTESGIVMGIRHKHFVMEGVQFHPESIASEQGNKIFANFLQWEGGSWKDMKIHPDRIRSTVTERVEEDLSHGIPLGLASKMNSTANHTWTSQKESESILVRIIDKRKQDVALDKGKRSMQYLERLFALGCAPTIVDFKQRVLDGYQRDGIAIAAEIKRASPSKGDIDIFAHAPQQALTYTQAGASVISVLTEPNWFKGSLDDIKEVRKVLESVIHRPAILRKEFIFDSYQILEARLSGSLY
jgi:anthranilate synthase / indole-3-glycerol phosphate synthase / phosphoribosylanthranilate isomerase